jgi:hypothetical protein
MKKKDKYTIVELIRCEGNGAPYPSDCRWRTPALYLRQSKGNSREGIKYQACGYAVNGSQLCEFSRIFDPSVVKQ